MAENRIKNVEQQLRSALEHYTSIRLGRPKKTKIKESHNLYQGQDISLGPPKYKSGNVNHYSLILSLVYILFIQRKYIIERNTPMTILNNDLKLLEPQGCGCS